MAALQLRNGSYRILFRYLGKQKTFTIGQVSPQEAEAKAAQVNYLLLRLKQGLAAIPPRADILEYLQFDGKIPPTQQATPANISLALLTERYLTTHTASLEPTTLNCLRIHFRHWERILGADFPITELKLADLQRYVDQRSKAKGLKGRKLSPTTIHKEIVTLRTVWNWGTRMEFVSGKFPNKGLRYPKSSEKPPFQTRQEIEQRIAAGKLSEAERADLWDALYLPVDEISALLNYVKEHSQHAFLYPLFVFAAHTGARRSEILRAEITDLNFDENTVLIHEKKRVRGQNSTRRVPMTPQLVTALKEWLTIHPGGSALFCHQPTVRYSRKRSPTTGAAGSLGPNTRKTREPIPPSPLTANEFHDHFKRALANSDWAVLRGAHALRHSFCSALAAKAVDQRVIDELMGHQTEDMRRRYRHLTPSSRQAAVAAVFG